MVFGLTLEELHAAPAERQRDLHGLLAQGKIFGMGQSCRLEPETRTDVSWRIRVGWCSGPMMTTIRFEFTPSAFGALRLSPDEFAREMRIAAAVQWYAQGVVSQGKAAELAGLTRADFLDELYRRRVPACQVGGEELADEIHGD